MPLFKLKGWYDVSAKELQWCQKLAFIRRDYDENELIYGSFLRAAVECGRRCAFLGLSAKSGLRGHDSDCLTSQVDPATTIVVVRGPRKQEMDT